MSFEKATRQNKRRVFTLPYDPQNRVSDQLPPTGLLANLYIRVEGTITTTGSGTMVQKAAGMGKPFSLIDRLQVTANGSTDIVSISGHGLFVRNLMTDNSYVDILAANMIEAESGNPIYQWSNTWAVATTYPVAFTLKVPIVNNDRDLTGLIMLQNRETLVQVAIDWANISNLFTFTSTAAATFAGNAYVSEEYYQVPRDPHDYPDLSIIHKLSEDKVPIDGTGDFVYTVPRGAIFQRMIHRVVINDNPAAWTDITQVGLNYNLAETPYYMDYNDKLVEQRERYKRDLPKGTVAWDFSYQGQAGLGGSRDLVNSAGITDFTSLIRVASGASLGTNNNYVRTTHEQLVPLA